MSIFQLVSWFRLLFLYLSAYSILRFSPDFNHGLLQNRIKTASAARNGCGGGFSGQQHLVAGFVTAAGA